MSESLGEVAVLPVEGGPELPIVAGGGRAHAIVWPGIGARLRSMHRISLEPGARTVELQHVSDAVYYVIAGGGQASDRHSRTSAELIEGSMAHVDAGTPYALVAGPGGIDLVGGPSPADHSLYREPVLGVTGADGG